GDHKIDQMPGLFPAEDPGELRTAPGQAAEHRTPTGEERTTHRTKEPGIDSVAGATLDSDDPCLQRAIESADRLVQRLEEVEAAPDAGVCPSSSDPPVVLE